MAIQQGMSQQSPAMQHLVRSAFGLNKRKGTKRRRKAKRATTTRKRKSSRKLKFGSPAWQKKYKVGKYKR
jgi:hypothetical protein